MSNPEVDVLIKAYSRASAAYEKAYTTELQARCTEREARERTNEAFNELHRIEKLLLTAIKDEGSVYKDGP
jgi:hypothetical protein